MKIITWNVNGLRAVLQKGAWEWISAQSADAICLQEIKVRPEQLSSEQLSYYDGFEAHWHPAHQRGYSGVVTLLKSRSEEVILGLGETRFDIEGRIISTRHPGFVLMNVYVPNGKRDLTRLSYKLDFYARLLELCDRMHTEGERIVICGDFNTAHREIDLRYPKQNEKTSGFLPEERAWIDKYLAHGFVDVYRKLYPDRVQYTWWTYRLNARSRNIGWRLDYFLVSETLISNVKEVTIHEEVMGSDHCPVTLELSTNEGEIWQEFISGSVPVVQQDRQEK